MIGPLDLLIDRPDRLIGRGAPRLLRYSSALVLVALLGSVVAAAVAAVRAPGWTDDLEVARTSVAHASPRAEPSGVRHAGLLDLLAGLEDLPGVRLEQVEVRSGSGAGVEQHPTAGRSSVLVRVALAATDVAGIREVLTALEHPAVLQLDVVDYSLTPSGAVASLSLQVRSDTDRLEWRSQDEDPTTRIPELVRGVGAEVLSVRLPGPDMLGQQVLLTSIGSVASIIRVVDRLESSVTSTGRVATVGMRRHDDGRAVLDIAFTLRESPSDGGSER
jgi:hypothetical protein